MITIDVLVIYAVTVHGDPIARRLLTMAKSSRDVERIYSIPEW